MKKLLLLFLLINNSTFFCQVISPNPTYFTNFSSCFPLTSISTQSETFLNNLTVPSGVNYSSIDLDITQPGIQNYNYNFGIHIQSNSFGNLIIQIFNDFYNPILIEYNFTSNSGIQSTVGLITIYPNLTRSFESNFLNSTCDNPNSGGFTINYQPNGFSTSGPTPITLDLYKATSGGPYILVNTFTTTNYNFPVTGLSKGTYKYVIHPICGGDLLSTNDYQRVVRSQNPITGTASATYIDFNANGIVDVGDLMSYQFSYTNNSTSCTMQNVGSDLSALSVIPILLPGQTLSQTPFNYVLTQNDINNASVILHTKIISSSLNSYYDLYNYIDLNTPLNISNGIKLIAFIDINGNGVKDVSEQNYINGTFGYQINSGVIHNVNTSNGILYLYETNPSNNYNLNYNINNNNICGSQNIVSNPIINNVYVTNGSGITTYNFAITPVPCVDVSVNMYSITPPRPGFNYTNIIKYTNNGNSTISTGTIIFNKSTEILTFNASDGGWPGISNTSTGFNYNFTNLLPNETRIITVTMLVPTIPTVSLGQQLTNSASITIPANDININNNNSSLTQTIVGSYDPNDKTESHGGRILRSSFTNNDYLTYTIQFENTGTANAVTVKVNDVLNAKLDETFIKMVAASHNYVLDRTGSNLEWKFAGIDLPPSVANTQIGHGYVVFQIKPKAGYVVGDIIPNIANIYFDFNPAIITNTCTTEFVAALANDNFTFNNLKIYPNPVNNILNIENNSVIDNIEVSNVLGQTVLSQNNNNSKIDLSGLIAGIYFVKITSSGNEKIVKILKE
jgi:uncharacterized repeat protein (TIGR01451 family)